MAVSPEPETFEHFRILRREDGMLWELGRGAMGVTFKAIDTRLDSLVALKVIGARASLSATAHERFLREARTAASLRHPNVASVYHFGREGTDYFYAMEFVDGESIASIIRTSGPFAWRTALHAARQAASALGALHARQLVHRDIKPDNLMLTHEREADGESRQLKMIDFGLAKNLTETGGMTEGFLGTPIYASPEQCREMECDVRSDIYSLGITLWYMLAGKPPFTGHALRLLQQHVTEQPPLDALPAEIPHAVHSLLTRMLAKDPARRPQTPADLRREIDACATTEASSARTRSPPVPDTSAETLVEPSGTRPEPVSRAASDANDPMPGSAAAPPMTMPVPMTRFFGREQELATLEGWFRGGYRLVTLTGPGGAGKTRLALETARVAGAALGRRPFFVDLSDLTDARFIPRRVRDVLLPPLTSEKADAADAATVFTSITDVLSSAPSLLLFDNFEQLADTGADFVRILLARVGSLNCLVTSRRRLDLSGEREFSLPALALPPAPGIDGIAPETLAMFAGVQLFCDRAQAVRASFALTAQNAHAVAELCRKLEGIPLAIELAAARIDMLTPRQIAARLGESLEVLVGGKPDTAARHRTLRATMDWSYALLSPEEQRFLARLSVFRGGWTAEAAAVALEENGGGEDEALDRLAALRRCSLIVAEERGESMRYRMLETIRQYAGEQLADTGEHEAVDIRRRHRDFFLGLAVRAEPELRKSDQARWLVQRNIDTGHSFG